jgi:hypothetical protein
MPRIFCLNVLCKNVEISDPISMKTQKHTLRPTERALVSIAYTKIVNHINCIYLRPNILLFNLDLDT